MCVDCLQFHCLAVELEDLASSPFAPVKKSYKTVLLFDSATEAAAAISEQAKQCLYSISIALFDKTINIR